MHSICRGTQAKTKAKPKINKHKNSRNLSKPNLSSASVASPRCKQELSEDKLTQRQVCCPQALPLATLSLGSLAWGQSTCHLLECSQKWYLMKSWLMFGDWLAMFWWRPVFFSHYKQMWYFSFAAVTLEEQWTHKFKEFRASADGKCRAGVGEMSGEGHVTFWRAGFPTAPPSSVDTNTPAWGDSPRF